jgi:hypothetical protein
MTRKLVLLVVAMTALASGCVVYDDPHRGGPRYGERDHDYGYRDRDRDGVPDRADRRPDDPRRY